MRQNGYEAIESLTGEQKQRLHHLVQPVLNRDKRLARRLDAEDLAQEALLRLQEYLGDPAVRWSVGKQWPADKYWPTEDFARDVLNRLTAQKYGTDKQIERMSFEASDPELLGHGSLHREYEAVESRMELEQLIAGLPAKQREAVAAKLMAVREGVPLEEMCRRLGRNPQKDLENFKAVKRRYKK
jgi:DNA-directed RNA polymerase specialized sigma24 family protein